MRTQAVKLFASLLIIAGFSSVALNAQPTVKSVGSVRHGTDTQVTIVFFEAVDQTTATTPGNYTFPAGISVTGASLMTGLPAANLPGNAENPPPGGRVQDNECVVLTVTGLAPGASTAVTIKNVQDRSTPPGTIAPTTINFTDSGHTLADTGSPILDGRVIGVDTNGFDIFSGGRAQWANYDEVTIVYKQVTGDFDVQARAKFQAFPSHWARAGIMARESLNLGDAPPTGWPGDRSAVSTASRYVDMHVNPVTAYNTGGGGAGFSAGNNAWESHVRADTGGQTGSNDDNPGVPPYPNAWVRIQRHLTNAVDTISTYHGPDAVNWDLAHDRIPDDFPAGPLAQTLFVGP